MNVWLLILINNAEPESKVYIMGAFSDEQAAKVRMKEIGGENPEAICHISSVQVDGPQPPILVGVAPSDIMNECKKNSPNSM